MEQKRYKAAGIAVFAVAAGALLIRIIAYFIYSAWSLKGPVEDLVLDLIFTLPVQVLVCFAAPFLIYKLYQRKSTKEVFIDSNYKKTDIRVILLGALLGIAAIFVSQVIGSLWLAILMGFGYNYSPSGTQFSDTFNIGYFLFAIVFTGVLPALCEEFAMRGTFLNAMHGSLRTEKTVLVVMAVSFGLFHQNVVQLVYTAFFGAAMAYVVIKSRSIYPAVVAHFANNALVVVLSYADHYGWFSDPTYYLTANYGLVGMALTLAIGIGLGYLAIWGIFILTKKDQPKPLAQLYKPTIRESAFYIGAIVMTALSTIFTFAFGF